MIVFRVDGGSKCGVGHLVQCMAIAEQLRKRGFDTLFVVREGVELLEDTDFSIISLDNVRFDIEELRILIKILRKFDAKSLIVDLLDMSTEYSKYLWMHFKKPLIVIDYLGNKALYADIVINGMISPYFHRYKRVLPSTKYYVGAKYMVLREDFYIYHMRRKHIPSKCNNLLVCFGGADPTNITYKVVRLLINSDIDAKLSIIVGPAYQYTTKLVKLLNRDFCKQYELLINVRKMAEVMYNADIAVTTAGITVYELATVGTPTLMVNRDYINNITAEEFQRRGFGKNLGLAANLSSNIFVETVINLLEDRETRKKMSVNGKKIVDSRGLWRVTNIIINTLESN